MTGARAIAARPPLGLLAPAVAAAMLVMAPLCTTLLQAGHVGIEHAVAVLVRPLVGRLLFNTLALVAASTLCAGALGTAAAYVLERTAIPGKRMWSALVVAPLAVPAFIASYAWVSLSPNLQDFAGALLVVTASYYPLVYLPVAATLRNMDPAFEETARSLGCGPWTCFGRAVLPHLRPALFGGMLLVALNVLVEFGAFSLLRFRTFTTEIYAEYRTGFNGPEASLLAVVLLAFCFAFLALEIRLRGGARYARVGAGARRWAAPHRLGLALWPVLFGLAALVIASLGVPLGMIVFWLMQHAAAATSPIAVSVDLLARSAAASLGFGAAAAALTLALALPLGYLATRYQGWRVTLLERAAYLAQGMPAIVVALALVSLTVHALRPLYQSATLLVFAYAILFLPLALVSVRAVLMQTEPGLEEAGRSLGLGWMSVAVRVTLPLAGPGLGAAAALVFVSVVTELTATLLLAPIGTQTLATEVWADTSTLAFAAAAPYAALMVAISLASTWLLAQRFGASAVFGAAKPSFPPSAGFPQ